MCILLFIDVVITALAGVPGVARVFKVTISQKIL